MNCPHCNQEVEAGALYCGNCGQALTAAPVVSPNVFNQQFSQQPPPSTPVSLPAVPVAVGNATVPAYALATEASHQGELKSLVALLFGVAGIIGSIFIAIVGLVFGLVCLFLATTSRSSHHRSLNTSAIVLGATSILAGLAVWGIAIAHDPRLHPKAAQSSSAFQAASFSTPCYSAGFINKLNIESSSSNCNATMYNGATFASSTDAYKIYSNQSTFVNLTEFYNLAKKAVDQDLTTNLSGFKLDSEGQSSFAGSPAYVAHAYDSSQDVAVAEGVVYHLVSSGQNVFILVHAINGRNTDFNTLGGQWQWK